MVGWFEVQQGVEEEKGKLYKGGWWCGLRVGNDGSEVARVTGGERIGGKRNSIPTRNDCAFGNVYVMYICRALYTFV